MNEKIIKIIEMAKENKPSKEIAEEVGMSVNYINVLLCSLRKLCYDIPSRKKYKKWNNKEVEILKAHMDKGHKASFIAKKMKRTEASINIMMSKIKNGYDIR